MGLPKILLLNLSPTANLVAELRGILESSFELEEVRFEQEPDAGCELANCGGNLSRVISRYNPALIFLVQAASLLDQTRQLFQSIKGELSPIPVIIVVETCEPDEMFAWLELVAADFITQPLKAFDVLPRVWRLLEMSRQRERPAQKLREQLGMRQLVGESQAFLAEIEKIPLVAKCDASVLISGETGTGKELCARAVHYLSPRARQPFIPVNCGAIPAELVENELFGHVRGAFTDAKISQPGLIQEADGGTLFLDEIDCLPPLAQVKLLRFLQEKEYRPLGSTKISKANVRIIAATNVDCEKAVKDGRLRQDLYYRLNVIPLMLPPLRERGGDVLLLARHFLVKYTAEFNKQIINFSSAAMQKLALYKWPGNVRELEHIIMRAVILSEQPMISAAAIIISGQETPALAESFQEAKNRMVAEFEKTYIEGLLLACHGNITKAAQAAQKNRRAFWQLIRKHQISVQSLKSIAS
jgi:two-component system response regulator GlrR